MTTWRTALLTASLALLAAAPARSAGRPWTAVRTWGYQLQRPAVKTIAGCPFDLVVIDHSRDGGADGRFTSADVARMQRRPDGARRLVVAYMSIGEAEPYRAYWRPGWGPGKPSWLLKPNPRWPDNYRVQYWDPEWQRLIFGGPDAYLDQILAAGFDGVYLDIVDGYEGFAEKRPTAQAEMVDFVRRLAAYARKTSGNDDFGVFPQNAPDLLEDPGYRSVITGIGKEELYFAATDERTGAEDRTEEERLLGLARAEGKLVLCIDYVKKLENAQEAIRLARAKGFIPYVGRVELDRLVKQPTARP